MFTFEFAFLLSVMVVEDHRSYPSYAGFLAKKTLNCSENLSNFTWRMLKISLSEASAKTFQRPSAPCRSNSCQDSLEDSVFR